MVDTEAVGSAHAEADQGGLAGGWSPLGAPSRSNAKFEIIHERNTISIKVVCVGNGPFAAALQLCSRGQGQ